MFSDVAVWGFHELGSAFGWLGQMSATVAPRCNPSANEQS
jgi:hypothetical protein